MKKLLLFFVVLLAGLQIASAQSMSVSGKVTYADDGTPVIGAQVMVKGMRGVGTLTDVNGAYKITIPAAAPEKVIVVSFLGLQSQERAISSNGQVVNFALAT
ncbi:MAG: carboxypeptidase-like regulatory domain-containing protein, partial [Mucinivorans sp.]